MPRSSVARGGARCDADADRLVRITAYDRPFMRIPTWNVNSLKARLPRVEEFLGYADVDVLCASVQTLARAAHLERFSPQHFDYVVVDEFHHAAAATYRRLLAHFAPAFLLGLPLSADLGRVVDRSATASRRCGRDRPRAWG